MKKYKEELQVAREMFYNEESMFGIYSCKPVKYNADLINKWGNLSIKGTTRKLAVGDEYEVLFEGKYDDDYGGHYRILEVAPEKLNTVEDQDKFLQAVIVNNHFASLKRAYPNEKLVDLIMSDGIDVKKTKGIKKKTLASIKEKVEKNAGISVLIAKLHALNLSTNKIDRIMKHFGNSDLAIKAIDENIYNLCELAHFGFLTVDKVALSRGDNPTNPNRIKACVDYLLKKSYNDGHTWSYRGDILDEAIETLSIDSSIVDKEFTRISKNKEYYSDEEIITFSRIRENEFSLHKHLTRIQDSFTPPKLQGVDWKIEEVERKQGFQFTEEQRDTIINVASNHGVSIINGLAGSGKSSVIKCIITLLETDSYMTATLSGKAANILEKNGLNASTIHRMLKWNPKDNNFQYNEHQKLPFEAIVLDEISMNSINLILAVIKASENKCKIIMVGDSGQLPSIGSASGDVLRDLLDTDQFPSFELTKVHRQKGQNSGILEVASLVREGKQLMPYDHSGKEVYGKLEDQTLISYRDKFSILPDILNISRAYKAKVKTPEDLFDFQVIVPNREKGELSSRNVNIKLQEIFNNLEKPSLNRNGYDYRQSDKIISVGNKYSIEIFDDEFAYYDFLEQSNKLEEENKPKVRTTNIYNGTLGYIFDVIINEKTLLIQFEDVDGLVAISQSDADTIELAYAATCHRMQGSGIKNVICALSFESFMMLTKQMLYTMITRASGKGALLVENNAMYTAIQNDAGRRRTFLKEIISNSMN